MEDLFGHLPRSDQRHWAQVYIRGLLTAQGRKSPRNLALAATGSPDAAHALHQFVGNSPWDWAPVRERLARRVAERLPVRAQVLAAALIPKRGSHSVGVGAHFDPAGGRAVKAQVGVGLFLSTGRRAVPVDWRLVLDEEWCADPVRRRRVRLPESAVPCQAWQHALTLASGAGPLPVVADARCAEDLAPLAAELTRRGTVFLAETGTWQRVVPVGGPARPVRVDELPSYDGDDVVRTALVRPVEAGSGAVGAQVLRLWRLRAPEPGRTVRWAVTNSRHLAAGGVRGLLRHADAAQASLAALNAEFGLSDFEGRSYPGWHHHMTLTSVAHALATLRRGPAAGEPDPTPEPSTNPPAPASVPPTPRCPGALARGA
ncbi:transposase [Streptomyces sp. NBC_01373]|uniref:IS701 family transposase n=1 Tax=Streptomyces sp. NBC_01373 TaxID=2903843 RepID=UPI0022539C5F|nr:transposase [Streptomyces sp. NBC_01373]MCX4698826.1 transposase [Streptomyces sp. NBC_01373]